MDEAEVAKHMQSVVDDGFVVGDTRFDRLKQWHGVLFQVMSAQSYLAELAAKQRKVGDTADMFKDLALLSAFVLQYAKCFTSSGKGQAMLDERKVFGSGSDALRAHQRVMEIRHNFVAHNGDSDLVLATLAVREFEDRFVVRHLLTNALPLDELPRFQLALDVVEHHVILAMNKNLDSLGEKLGKFITLQDG